MREAWDLSGWFQGGTAVPTGRIRLRWWSGLGQDHTLPVGLGLAKKLAESIHMNLQTIAFTAVDSRPAPAQPESREMLRRPVLWIVVWATYSLLALGYFGYQSAWLSTMCITPQ